MNNGQRKTLSIISAPPPTLWAGQGRAGLSTATVSIGSGKDHGMRDAFHVDHR